MGLFVSTVSTNISISELGITLVHPAVDFQISSQFSPEEISRAISLTSAITGGTLVWRKTAGGANELAANYDPDFIDLENEATGTGNIQDRGIRWLDLNPEEVGNTNTITTNSTSDVPMTGMIIPAPDAGTYLVFFSSSFDSSSNSAIVRASIYSGGVLKSDSTRRCMPRASGGGNTAAVKNLNLQGRVTVNGSQDIEIRWRTSAGTATAYEKTLNILRIA